MSWREASRLMQARDWRGALAFIDQALSIEPRDAKLLIDRAQCLLALGRLPDACAAAAAAQSSARPEPSFFDALGSLFSRGNDQARALSAFDRATVNRFLGHMAEVRRQLYDTSVSQWRHHSGQLAQLDGQLRAAGFHTE